MAIPLPALDVQPPRPTDLLSQYGKLVSLKSMIGQQAMIPQEAQELALRNRMLQTQGQQAQLQLQQQQALANALRGGGMADSQTAPTASGQPEAITGQIGEMPIRDTSAASPPAASDDPFSGIEQEGIEAMRNGAGGYGVKFLQGVTGLRKNMAEMEASRAAAAKSEQATNAGGLDALANGASAVLASGNDPRVVNTFLDVMGNFLPKEAGSLRAAFQANPASVAPTMQALRAYSVKQMEAQARTEQANRKVSVSLQGPNGPMQAIFDPHTGKYFSANGEPIANPVPMAKGQATPYADWKREHPNGTVEQWESESQSPSFPRVEPVTDAQGNTLGYNYLEGQKGGGVVMKYLPAGAGGAPTANGVIPPKPTGTTLTMSQMAQTVLPMASGLVNQVKQTAGQLGPLAGRWNEVMTGKVGANNPAVASLQMNLKMYASALVRTHFGARGGQEYIKGMENYLNMAQSPQDLVARINSADSWLQGYSAMTGHGAPAPSVAPTPSTHVLSLRQSMRANPGVTQSQIKQWAQKNGYQVRP